MKNINRYIGRYKENHRKYYNQIKLGNGTESRNKGSKFKH